MANGVLRSGNFTERLESGNQNDKEVGRKFSTVFQLVVLEVDGEIQSQLQTFSHLITLHVP